MWLIQALRPSHDSAATDNAPVFWVSIGRAGRGPQTRRGVHGEGRPRRAGGPAAGPRRVGGWERGRAVCGIRREGAHGCPVRADGVVAGSASAWWGLRLRAWVVRAGDMCHGEVRSWPTWGTVSQRTGVGQSVGRVPGYVGCLRPPARPRYAFWWWNSDKRGGASATGLPGSLKCL